MKPKIVVLENIDHSDCFCDGNTKRPTWLCVRRDNEMIRLGEWYRDFGKVKKITRHYPETVLKLYGIEVEETKMAVVLHF